MLWKILKGKFDRKTAVTTRNTQAKLFALKMAEFFEDFTAELETLVFELENIQVKI